MRLLILDRDGVINHDSAEFIKSPAEWRPICGSLAAVAQANRKGYRVVVTSNQSGLARGLFDFDSLNKIHTRMLAEIAQLGGRIDAIFFCPHLPEEHCECRKPRTGLLRNLGARLGVDLAQATMVGDRSTDLAAAAAVGATPILVRTGHGLSTLAHLSDDDVMVYDDLAAVVANLDQAD